jgi:hypothetical protein
MKVKVSESSSHILDWLVDEALLACNTNKPKYSTDWRFCGPIIEQECIELSVSADSLDGMWVAKSPGWYLPASGPTPLIAAMRCYVVSKLGEEVEVPVELV